MGTTDRTLYYVLVVGVSPLNSQYLIKSNSFLGLYFATLE